MNAEHPEYYCYIECELICYSPKLQKLLILIKCVKYSKLKESSLEKHIESLLYGIFFKSK